MSSLKALSHIDGIEQRCFHFGPACAVVKQINPMMADGVAQIPLGVVAATAPALAHNAQPACEVALIARARWAAFPVPAIPKPLEHKGEDIRRPDATRREAEDGWKPVARKESCGHQKCSRQNLLNPASYSLTATDAGTGLAHRLHALGPTERLGMGGVALLRSRGR